MNENTPFIAPSPTTTAHDLRQVVEDLQSKRQSLDRKLMALLPNLIVSHMITLGRNQADLENRSAHCVLRNSDLFLMLPSPAMASLYSSPPCGDEDVRAACNRIMSVLDAPVTGILTHLDFTCTTVFDEINHQLTIDISW